MVATKLSVGNRVVRPIIEIIIAGALYYYSTVILSPMIRGIRYSSYCDYEGACKELGFPRGVLVFVSFVVLVHALLVIFNIKSNRIWLWSYVGGMVLTVLLYSFGSVFIYM